MEDLISMTKYDLVVSQNFWKLLILAYISFVLHLCKESEVPL